MIDFDNFPESCKGRTGSGKLSAQTKLKQFLAIPQLDMYCSKITSLNSRSSHAHYSSLRAQTVLRGVVAPCYQHHQPGTNIIGVLVVL